MTEDDVIAVIERFNAAWNRHDLDEALALMADDCVFESTGPAPDGEQYKGKEAVRRAWGPIFDNDAARFTVESLWVAADRVVQLWRYDWGDGHVRGVDVIRVAGGRIAEKLSYVKG